MGPGTGISIACSRLRRSRVLWRTGALQRAEIGFQARELDRAAAPSRRHEDLVGDVEIRSRHGHEPSLDLVGFHHVLHAGMVGPVAGDGLLSLIHISEPTRPY